MAKINVSIIILTKNAGSIFKTVLDQVFLQHCGSFEVILIDSGSTDNTLKIARRYPTKIVEIKPEEFGHGKTRNLGAKLAKGKYVIYLTHDAVPEDKNWLSELIKPLKNKKIVGVYGRQIPRGKENTLDKFFYLSLYPNRDRVWTLKKYLQGDNIFSNVNSAIKKNILIKYPFDRDIIVSEDYEWAHRILQKGYKIFYSSRAAVIHSHTYNLFNLFRRNFDIGVSYKKIYNPNKTSSFIRKGFKVHSEEVKYLLKSKKAYLILYCMAKDLTRFLAINLGRNEGILPKFMKKRFLSNQRWYWK